MRIPADIVVYDKFGQLLLLAEVRSREETTPAWATEIRQDIIRLMDGFLSRYFLVVSSDRTYLWTSPAGPETPPDETLDTEETFKSYLRSVNTSAKTISGNAMQLLVGIWLRDLTHGDEKARSALPQNPGLAKAVANGKMQFPDAA